MKYLFVLCFAISLGAIAEVPSDAVQFKLKRVSDGDTVVTTEDTRIRLWGLKETSDMALMPLRLLRRCLTIRSCILKPKTSIDMAEL
ncbi:hypothetical protein N9V97_00895 [Luminiphilus sp.]|nr:hypothetical protein [Luminiphilus sp.]MDB2377367.1 hypothetical protein [Luminiphilus sp.]